MLRSYELPRLLLLTFFLTIVSAVTLSATCLAAPPGTVPVEGLRENSPAFYAFTNATLVVEPGRVIQQGTLVVRDGSIVAVGSDLAIPDGAKVYDLSGRWLYPGLMDSYSETSVSLPSGGTRHWSGLITPEANAGETYEPDLPLHAKLRKQGVVCRLLAPAGGIIKGTSCIVSTADSPGPQSLWKAQVAQHLRLGLSRDRDRRGYPSSPMGAVALARQTFLDADWYPRAWNAYQSNRTLPQPDQNSALESLSEAMLRGDRFIIDAVNELYLLRADAFAREFSLNAIIRGSGREYRRLEAVQATGRPLILPVNFPKPPSVDSPEEIATVDLTDLLHWDFAPENPARLYHVGVRFAFSSADLSDTGDFLSRVRVAVERGLPADAALASLTTIPAELFGIGERFGTLAVGKSASFLVADGELFAKETKIEETWIHGERFPNEGADQLDIAGSWSLTITGSGSLTPPGDDSSSGDAQREYTLLIKGRPGKWKAQWEMPGADENAEKVDFTKFKLADRTLNGSLPGKAFGQPGVIQFSATLAKADDQPLKLIGRLAWPDGSFSNVAGLMAESEEPEATSTDTEPEKQSDSQAPEENDAIEPQAVDEEAKDEQSSEEPVSEQESPGEEPSRQSATPSESQEEKSSETSASGSDGAEGEATSEDKTDKPKKAGPAEFDISYPLGAMGRTTLPEQPEVLAFTNATVWTCGDEGVIEQATVIVRRGIIEGVGRDLPIPEGALVIDATGKHLTPGMIDCHSHTATDGGINESTQAITAEVRVGDFINCNDIDLYRQLAGGITTINILHGSANPIGGQNQVIKLRWGELYDQMRFTEAPAGIKFALGENVKRSNRSGSFPERYPISRMGVEQIIRDAFQAAKEYEAQWAAWRQDHASLPPRKDLELEALAEILRGERWVHCHSYRQDEILALLRVCEEYGIRIATLQHILEGYKVADAIARHGAMGSSFSDWWAYKVEVYDAIPYNGALMHQAGVVVSFNSDDRELARHMNHEAAKAIRYGNMEPAEALKFVTLNPAKQLRIDQYVGSIEKGKHADLVLWSGPPLSLLSRCEQTWVDGRRYFDIQEDLQMQEASKAMRTQLVQKILASGQPSESPSERQVPEEALWPQEDEFCRARSLR
jgi:imidazolonepropionase-like amidohydrolase